METGGEEKKTAGAGAAVAAAAKKRDSMNIVIRVVLYVLRRRSRPKSADLKMQAVTARRKGFWKTLLAAARPLRLEDRPPLPMIECGSAAGDDVASLPPLSPDLMASASSSSGNSMSRYASAEDLKELEQDGTGSEDSGDDAGGEDPGIDALAEAFIAKFYEQIQLQRQESINNRFNAATLDGVTN